MKEEMEDLPRPSQAQQQDPNTSQLINLELYLRPTV